MNTGVLKGEKYSILHLHDPNEFLCITQKDVHNTILKYVCQLPKNIFIPNFDTKYYPFLNLYFTQDTKHIYVNVEPKSSYSKLSLVAYDIFNTKERESHSFSKSNHWSIFFTNGEKNLIFNESSSQKGLDFDVSFEEIRPFIGTLDEDGKPFLFDNNEEIKALMDIKKIYDAGEYDKVLTEVNLAFQDYPKTIFKKELLLYLMRSYYHIGNEQAASATIEIALNWLDTYTSDSDIPEVLFYLGMGYSNLNQTVNAIRIFNELTKSYERNRFSFMAKLALGDNLISSSDLMESIRLYEDVLYNTNDIDIALLAAKKIADKSLDDGILKKAGFYYQKIVDKNIDFLMEDLDKAYELANKLILNKFENIAVKIIDRILEKIDKGTYPVKHQEMLFKNAGLYKAIDVDKAITYYQEYLETYPKGLYHEEAQRELDRLVFDFKQDGELDDDAILKNIEYLLKTYPGQPIAFRAFYTKR